MGDKSRKMRKTNFSLMYVLIILVFLPGVFVGADVLGVDCQGAFSLDPQAQAKCELETRYIYEAQIFIDQNDLIMNQTQIVTERYNQGLPAAIQHLGDIVLVVANFLLVLVLVYGGYIWIISAADPEQRHYAKKILTNFFFMIIFVNAAFFFFAIALDVSSSSIQLIKADTDTFFEAQPWENLTNSYAGQLNLTQSFERYNTIQSPSKVLFATGWSYVLLMHLRNIIILTVYVISPLVLVLLLFVPTRDYGKFLLVLFLVEVFVPILFFIIFRVAALLLEGSVDHHYNFILICSALFSSAVLHL